MPDIHELIDFIVEVYIIYKDRVLLIHHKKANAWRPIGGHIELDEDPEEALFREAKEESGLEIEVFGNKPDMKVEGVKFLISPIYLNIHKAGGKHRHIALIYFARSKSNKVRLAVREHNEIKWFTKKDLSSPKFDIRQDVKFYANQALKKLT